MTWEEIFRAMDTLSIEKMRVHSYAIGTPEDVSYDVNVYKVDDFKGDQWTSKESQWPTMEALLMENSALAGKVILLDAQQRTIQVVGDVRMKPESSMYTAFRYQTYHWDSGDETA